MNALRMTVIKRAIGTTGKMKVTSPNEMKIPAMAKTFHYNAISTTSTSPAHNRLPVAFQSFQQQHHQLQLRPFSSSSPLSSDTKELVALLSNERTAEEIITRNSSESSDLSDLKNKISSSWTIVDGSSTGTNNGDATTRMIRKEPLPNGAKVTLTFHCQDTLVEEAGMLDGMFDGTAEDGDADGSESEQDESPAIRFDVTVSRAGTTLHMSCISEDASASIESATVFTGDDADKNNAENEEAFRGPDLEELPEKVQEAFNLFLTQECGVNEDVAAFIAMWADYREQLEYVGWLDGVKKIVE